MHINPIKEYRKIAKWTDTLIGNKLLLRTFTSQLSRFLNRNGYPVKIKTLKSKDLELDDFTFGAEYDCELDEFGKKPIRVNFIINHPRIIPWAITKQSSQKLAIELTETLVHEIQHLHQYRARNYRVPKHSYQGNEEVLYLSHPDEIDAYSMNIAVRWYINKNILNKVNYKKHVDLNTYYKAFGKDHAVVKQLEQQIESKFNNIKESTHV